MADNQYTAPTLSGYNSNPPVSDGSQTEANQVNWPTHTNKIGDPLRNFSNAMNTNITSAFALTINTGSDQDNSMAGSLAYTSSELTIATGSVDAVRSHHTVDTENDDAADDLNTITVAGVSDGCILYLRLANASRVVTLKDNIGNIQTKNNEDIILDANIPTVLLRVDTDWYEVQRPIVDNPFDQDLNTTNNVVFAEVDGILGANTPAAINGTTGVFSGEVQVNTDVRLGGGSTSDPCSLYYSGTNGAILQGQGSSFDVVLRNDALANVLAVPTGTTNVEIVGECQVATNVRLGGQSAGDNCFLSYSGTNGATLGGQGSLYDVMFRNDALQNVLAILTGTQTLLAFGDLNANGNITGSTATVTVAASTSIVHNTHANNIVESTAAGAVTMTINSTSGAYQAGDMIIFAQYGTGQITVAAGAGYTMRTSANRAATTRAQHTDCYIRFRSATEFTIEGDLTVV